MCSTMLLLLLLLTIVGRLPSRYMISGDPTCSGARVFLVLYNIHRAEVTDAEGVVRSLAFHQA